MSERLLPVHCCCEPGKRLGYLPVREGALHDWRGGRHVQVLKPLVPGGLGEACGLPETFMMRLRMLRLAPGVTIEALDSGHQSIEVLRTLPGWRDA